MHFAILHVPIEGEVKLKICIYLWYWWWWIAVVSWLFLCCKQPKIFQYFPTSLCLVWRCFLMLYFVLHHSV